MSERDDLNLERTLRQLTPVVGGLDATELAFRAGRRSVKRSRFWPGLSGLLLTSQAVTLALWLSGPPPDSAPIRRPDQSVVVPTTPVSPPEPSSYAALRMAVRSGAERAAPPVSERPPSDEILSVQSNWSLIGFE